MSRPFKDQCPFPNELWTDDWFRRLEAAEIFPERSDLPFEVDLGCGDGGFLMAMAEAFPGRNFLGVERLLGRVRRVCKKIEKRGLTENAKTVRLETGYAVGWLLPRGAANRVHLLFPDPWPKRKHMKRRLMVRPDFLQSVHGLLVEGGEFIFKTDHPFYFRAAEETVGGIDFFERLPWPEESDEFFYPLTDFEKMWLAEGRKVHGMRLRRIEPS